VTAGGEGTYTLGLIASSPCKRKGLWLQPWGCSWFLLHQPPRVSIRKSCRRL